MIDGNNVAGKISEYYGWKFEDFTWPYSSQISQSFAGTHVAVFANGRGQANLHLWNHSDKPNGINTWGRFAPNYPLFTIAKEYKPHFVDFWYCSQYATDPPALICHFSAHELAMWLKVCELDEYLSNSGLYKEWNSFISKIWNERIRNQGGMELCR